METTDPRSRSLDPSSLSFLEDAYDRWLEDPLSMDPRWRRYFESLDGHRPARRTPPRRLPPAKRSEAGFHQALRQERVDRLAQAYRETGYRAARIHPLGPEPEEPGELDPAFYGLGPSEMGREFLSGFSSGKLPLREIVRCLRETYCGPVGIESAHIADGVVRDWLRDRLESTSRGRPGAPQRIRILTRLIESDVFEKFVRRKFLGPNQA